LVGVILYTVGLVLLQALWVARFSYPAMRADLLLPLMLGVAIEYPSSMSFFWAFLWGFAMDTLSGKFWGFHVGSYVLVVCLVSIVSEKIELQNSFYRMLLAGLCALGQSIVLGFFLLVEPSAVIEPAYTWKSMIVRSLVIMLISPAVILPVCRMRKAGG